jgi:hypothetical protein
LLTPLQVLSVLATPALSTRMTCDLPTRDEKQERIHSYLRGKHPGLAELYEATRLVRHLPAVPASGLMQAHLVREIKNGLINATLGNSERTELKDILWKIEADWAAVWLFVRSELERRKDDPTVEPLRDAAQRIVDELTTFKATAETSLIRTAAMFSTERGLRVDGTDPSVRQWERIGNKAHGSAHFPRTLAELPKHEKTRPLVDSLEVGIEALSLQAAEGLDEIDALVKEFDS